MHMVRIGSIPLINLTLALLPSPLTPRHPHTMLGQRRHMHHLTRLFRTEPQTPKPNLLRHRNLHLPSQRLTHGRISTLLSSRLQNLVLPSQKPILLHYRISPIPRLQRAQNRLTKTTQIWGKREIPLHTNTRVMIPLPQFTKRCRKQRTPRL